MRRRRTECSWGPAVIYRSSYALLCFTLGITQSKALPVQLDQNNFTSYLDTVPSHYGLLIEFYANWCPSCQHFAPTYEKVATYFNAEPKVKPEVVAARVDCATEVSLRPRLSGARLELV